MILNNLVQLRLECCLNKCSQFSTLKDTFCGKNKIFALNLLNPLENVENW